MEPENEGVHFRRTQRHPIIVFRKPSKCSREASRFVSELAGQGRAVLFRGTKRQAQEAVAEESKRCGAFFVNPPVAWRHADELATLQKSIKR